jgi:murein DD-endopeptidase MepM/ murein hydrolase activator NlpD
MSKIVNKEKIHQMKEKSSQILSRVKSLHAELTWRDDKGDSHLLHLGSKVITAAAGLFAVCVLSLALCAGLLSRAWQEQQELQNYRADYGVYTERLAKLMDNNEKLQRELSQVAKLEAAVREKLKQDGVKISEETIDKKSAEMDKQGKGGPSTADQLTVLEVQDEINWKRLAYKKENLNNMLLALSSTGDGTFGWPLDGGEISSFYGLRADPFGNGAEYHSGLDIAADFGSPVKAAAAGVVTEANWNGGYGRYVGISHGNGMSTAYGHMSAIAVTAGQHVTRGQVIGYVGSSGYSTGPHLHFEIRENGATQNPLQFAVPPRK